MQKTKYFTFFLPQSYFSVPKGVKLNSTHYLIMKTNKERELQYISVNNSADIDYKDFVNICRECTKKPISFLAIDTTFSFFLFFIYKNDSS